MTDTEILDWLEGAWLDITRHGTTQRWVIEDRVRGITAKAYSLREAVEKAARENGDG